MPDGTAPAKPSVRMSDDEIWSFAAAHHTGILTTLRADGRPVTLPVWFVTLEGRFYVSTRGRKLERLAKEPRCSFLVEDGERWAELRAAHFECTGRIVVPDLELAALLAEAMATKYGAFRTRAAAMPDATRAHYAAAGGWVELTPVGKVLNWDNSKLPVS